jgi:hypothetical protein
MAEKNFKIQNGLLVLEDSQFNDSITVNGTVSASTFIGDGSVLTGVVIPVNHGSNENFERPSYAEVVYWKGSVNPLNGINGDFWYDTSDDL